MFAKLTLKHTMGPESEPNIVRAMLFFNGGFHQPPPLAATALLQQHLDLSSLKIKNQDFCFDCIIRTSMVPAGAFQEC